MQSIRYDVHSESGGSLFVGISPQSSKGTKHFWESGKSVGYSKEYTGDYYVYIQSKYGDCSNITGTIVIE